MPTSLRGGCLSLCALLLLASLAGCAEPADDGDADAELAGVASADFEGGETIRGIVTDEELNPIAGALIQVGSDATATSNDQGKFEVINVEPGQHRIVVQALGYRSVARTVTVEAGAPVEVAFKLEIQTIEEPYHDYLPLVGFVCLRTYTAGVRLTYGNFACPDSPGSVIVPFEAFPGVKTIVSEMTWEQTSALSASVLGIDLWQGGVRNGVWTCDYCYGSAQGESPVTLRLDGPFEGVNGEEAPEASTIDNIIFLPGDPAFAGQLGVAYSQRVDLYTSVFYGAEAPADYSGLPDA